MQFSSNFSYTVTKDQFANNVIISPISIRICLALLYMGARGATAEQLKCGLCINGNTKEAVAKPFSLLLENIKKSGVEFKIANRIYLQDKLITSREFNNFASKYFESSSENVNFSEAEKAAKLINVWVEENTEKKIRNVLNPKTIKPNTKIILVNAIYFKAKWKKIFSSNKTKRHEFNVTTELKVPVRMMYQEDDFYFGELGGLGAFAIELPYADSDLSMLILVPRRIGGLSYLEAKLQYVDLTKLKQSLKWGRVKLGLPKFKIEFDISLQPVLQQLGMGSIFTDRANFDGLLTRHLPLKVSEVRHNAFIEVDEGGTEGGDATYAKTTSAKRGGCRFVIDQPFFFAIKDTKNVYFTGHVASFF